MIEPFNGFVPQPGDSFVIMKFENSVGEFDTVLGQTIDSETAFVVSYGANDVTLMVVERMSGDCDMDFDADLVDHAELEVCLAGPDYSVLGGCGCFDLNNSGTVDLADVAEFQTTFSSSE